MNATVIGGGRIGRGFVSSLLKRNGVSINFFDISCDLTSLFNSKDSYTVHVLGNPHKNTIVSDFNGYLIDDIESLSREFEKTNIVFTSVGGKNLVSLGKKIAKAYKNCLEKGTSPHFIIITCENWIKPADDLKESILYELSPYEKEKFLNNVDITQSVIRASGTSAPTGEDTDNELDTWVQDYWILPVDKKRIIKNNIPKLKFFDFDENFGEMLAQKIYTNNTSVAIIAYLGYLKGHKYVADAANDPEIQPILDECYNEINYGLINVLGVSKKSQLEFSKIAKKKYQDPNIVDYVVRIGRDPLRKLAPDDRLIAPAKMAIKSGITPKAIAYGTAAALYFDYLDDPIAICLKEMREQYGNKYVLKTVCGLGEGDQLTKLILQCIEELKQKKWIKEGEFNG
ncbi:hypothetical protein [Clostridium sp. Marseille-Q2269]|uniref:mannitol dehydrogenase family protein n=1 Tax=Clostridium sp. Marseille-Q2269 TaxID=2942205 RepID=UPI00207406E8|nr:hypothetical protein [Clostridium sp. Marseille-Q2269]